MLNLIGVLVAFAVIILLIRLKVNFGASLIIGSVVLGVFSLRQIALIDIPKAIIAASVYSFETNQIVTETIELALLLFFIYMLAMIMQDTKAINKLIASLRTLVSREAILGVVPAVYGLMPVPGGALFSIPTVDEEGKQLSLTDHQKNFINIWFRHIWFTVYPVSSALIFICSEKIFDINIYHLILLQIPAFLFMIGIGLFLIKRFTRTGELPPRDEQRDYSGLIYLLPPLLPLPVSFLLIPLGVPQVRSFLIGILLSIPLVFVLTKTPRNAYKRLLKQGLSWKMPLAIFGIMIFREMFHVSNVETVIGTTVQSLMIPPLLIIVLIPLFFGVIMGYNLGAIGVSFPIIAAFLPLFGGGNIVALASIVYVSSLAGYLFSPLHLCNVVSSEYLEVDVTGMYKMLVPASLLLLLLNTIIMLVVL